MREVILHPRYADARLVEALTDSPVVLVHGPRQCGKTTLARLFAVPVRAMGETTSV
jgi:predicted AAA+ superfamily ATPase